MKSRTSIIARILMATGLAAIFNRNVTAPHVSVNHAAQNPITLVYRGRKPGYRTGIKGMASSNNTRSGSALKAHFDRTNTRMNEHGVMVKA